MRPDDDVVAEGARADCEVGADLTRRLRLPAAVSQAMRLLAGLGHGAGRLRILSRAPGNRARPRSDATVPPPTAPPELLRISNPDDLWAAVVDAEPAPRRTFRDKTALDEALAGFADDADLMTPWFHGHSGGVAQLARTAAARVAGTDADLVYRAGLLHDLGRVAVPTGIR